MKNLKPSKGPAKVRPSTYQPSRRELQEDITINAFPEEVLRSVLRPRPVQFDKNGK